MPHFALGTVSNDELDRTLFLTKHIPGRKKLPLNILFSFQYLCGLRYIILAEFYVVTLHCEICMVRVNCVEKILSHA